MLKKETTSSVRDVIGAALLLGLVLSCPAVSAAQTAPAIEDKIISKQQSQSNTRKAAPDFVISGEQRLSDLTGKVVYLDFWASWCGPCRKSFPWLNKISQSYQSDDFVVLSVNLDTEMAKATDFLKVHPAEFSITYDAMGDIARDYNVMGMPSSYIIDHNGNIATTHMGFKESKIPSYEHHIAQLVAAKKSQQAQEKQPLTVD